MSVVCTISEGDLAKISRMDEAKLRRKTHGLSYRGILQLMRDLQISLAAYAKKYGANGKVDEVQMGMVRVIGRVEKFAREQFTAERLGEICRANPSFLTHPDSIQTHKLQVAKEWAIIYRKFAY